MAKAKKGYQLKEPEAYTLHLERNKEHADVILSSMERDLEVHRNSGCNPKRIEALEACYELALSCYNKTNKKTIKNKTQSEDRGPTLPI